MAVIGRGPDTAPPPSPPLTDRHGIPNAGPCIRCNLQLEGSGVSADDVVVEAGDAKAGNSGPSAVGHKKDVGIFVDRADGGLVRSGASLVSGETVTLTFADRVDRKAVIDGADTAPGRPAARAKAADPKQAKLF